MLAPNQLKQNQATLDYEPDYAPEQITLSDIERWPGPLVIEFGSNGCGHCQAAKAIIAQGFAGHEQLTYYKIEDGKGRRLGRVLGVKLWPTLIFLGPLTHGRHPEVARLVRPTDPDLIKQALLAM